MSLEADLNKLIIRNKDIYDFINSVSEKDELKINDFITKYILNTYLYRFRSGNDDRDLENLKADTIWCSNLNNLNDPFEGKLFYNEDILINIKLGRNVPQNFDFNDLKIKAVYLKLLSTAFKNSYNIACFTEDLYNFNMWANYSNSFSGYCLKYNKMDIYLFTNKKKEEKSKKIDYQFFPVVYESLNDFKEINKVANDGSSAFNTIYALLQKPTEFLFEKEWRLIANDNLDGTYDSKKDEAGINIDFIKPEAVFLGKNIKDQLKKKLIIICKQKNIKIYQMEEKFNNKNIIFKEVIL